MKINDNDAKYYMGASGLTEMLNKAFMAAGNTWGYSKVETERITNTKGGHSNRSVFNEEVMDTSDSDIDLYDEELNLLLLEISTRLLELLDPDERLVWLGILWISGNFDAANKVYPEEMTKNLNAFYYTTILTTVESMKDDLNEELYNYLHSAPELLLYEPQKLKATLNSGGVKFSKSEFTLIKEIQKSLKKTIKSEKKILSMIGIKKKVYDTLNRSVFDKLSSLVNEDQYKILLESLILWEN